MKLKFPNPKYYWKKLTKTKGVYWGVIVFALLLATFGTILILNRHNKAVQEQSNPTSPDTPPDGETTPPETTPPAQSGAKAAKLILKKGSATETAAGIQAVLDVQIIGNDGKVFAVTAPTYLDVTVSPDTSTGNLLGDNGGSIYIPTGASSTRIYYTDTKSGAYNFTIGFGSLTRATAVLNVKPAAVATVLVNGPKAPTTEELSQGVEYTAAALDQYGNPTAATFEFTVLNGSTDIGCSFSSALSCILKDSGGSCSDGKSWKITAKSGSVPGSLQVIRSDCSVVPGGD